MQEFETTLSSARLKLLDKRKEIRDAVHEHYRDLIGVSDHAVAMNGFCTALAESFNKIAELNRKLGSRAHETDIPRILSVAGAPASQVPDDSHLSLDGRVLFHCLRHEYKKLGDILDSEAPSSQLRSCMERHCWAGLASPALDNLELIRACLSLLQRLISEASRMHAQFWATRSSLLQRLSASGDGELMLRHYELSLGVGLGISESFQQDYGGPDGLVAAGLFALFHKFPRLPALVSEYKRVCDSVGVMGERAQNIVSSAACKAAESCVRTTISDDLDEVSFGSDETFNLRRIDEQLGLLLVSIDSFALLDKSPIQVVGTEFQKRIMAACHETEQQIAHGELHWLMAVGINAARMVAAIQGTHAEPTKTIEIVAVDYVPYCKHLCRISSQLDAVVAKLEVLSLHAFRAFWGKRLTGWKYIPEPTTNFGSATVQDTEVKVPVFPSNQFMDTIVNVCNTLAQVPVFAVALAAGCAKKCIAQSLVESVPAVSLQSLFDLHFAIIVLSHSGESCEPYSALSTDFLTSIEKQVLADAVDWLLYKDIVRVAAVDSVVRTSNLLCPMVYHANPMFVYACEQNRKNPPGIVLAAKSLSKKPAIDRFQVLPVTRVNHFPKATAPVPKKQAGGFNANSVTSFFNQMGKITLGGQKNAK